MNNDGETSTQIEKNGKMKMKGEKLLICAQVCVCVCMQ